VKVNLKIACCVAFKGCWERVKFCARRSRADIFRARESWHGEKRRRMPEEGAVVRKPESKWTLDMLARPPAKDYEIKRKEH